MSPPLPCEISGLPERSPSLIDRESRLLTMSAQGQCVHSRRSQAAQLCYEYKCVISILPLQMPAIIIFIKIPKSITAIHLCFPSQLLHLCFALQWPPHLKHLSKHLLINLFFFSPPTPRLHLNLSISPLPIDQTTEEPSIRLKWFEFTVMCCTSSTGKHLLCIPLEGMKIFHTQNGRER